MNDSKILEEMTDQLIISHWKNYQCDYDFVKDRKEYELFFSQIDIGDKKKYVEMTNNFDTFEDYVIYKLYSFKENGVDLEFLQIIKPICPLLMEDLKTNLLWKWKIVKTAIEFDLNFDYDILIAVRDAHSSYSRALEKLSEYSLITKLNKDGWNEEFFSDEYSDEQCDMTHPLYRLHHIEEEKYVPEKTEEDEDDIEKTEEDEDEVDDTEKTKYTVPLETYLSEIKPLVQEKLIKMKQNLLEKWDMIKDHFENVSIDCQVGDFEESLLHDYEDFRDKCIANNLIPSLDNTTEQVLKLY